MLRSDMLSELGHSDTNISINYNLSGCDYKDTSFYHILWANLSCGRSIRVVGESSRFCALSKNLPIAGNDTAITRYRRYEEDETESEHDNTESESKRYKRKASDIKRRIEIETVIGQKRY